MKCLHIFFCVLATGLPLLAQQEFEKLPQVPPIPQTPNAKLAKDIESANRKWAERVLVQPFKARLKGEVWAAAATAFVDHAVEYWADLNTASRRLGDLPKEGADVLAKGCADPLVLYFFSAIKMEETREWRAGQAEAEKALKIVTEEKSYSRALAHFIARLVGDRAEKSGKAVDGLPAKTAEWIAAEWKDGSYQPGEESLFVHHEMGRWHHIFPEEPDRMKDTYEALPLPEWARKTLIARLRLNQVFAWKNANRDKQKDPEISKLDSEAYRGFADAWKLNPEEPWAAAEAVRYTHTTATAAKEPTRREWLDRAVSAQFDLESPYRIYLDSLATTLGAASDGQLLAFGRACLETRRFDTLVPSLFRTAVSLVGEKRDDLRAFYANPQIAKPLVVLCLETLRDKSSANRRASWTSWLAIYAWLAGEPLQAERMLGELKTGLEPEAVTLLRRMQLDEPILRAEIAIAKADGTEELAAARRLLEAANYDSVNTKLDALAKQAGPAAAPVLTRLRMAAEFETELAKGEWVRLKVPDHLEGWTIVSGKWDARDGVITLDGNDASAVLLAPGRAGRKFEMRGDVEIECRANCCRAFGVTFGYMRPTSALAIAAEQHGSGAPTLRVWSSTKQYLATPPPADCELLTANHFHCKVDGQELTMELNGAKPLDGYQLRQYKVPPNARFGFTMAKACSANSWRIKNIEVRRLPAE